MLLVMVEKILLLFFHGRKKNCISTSYLEEKMGVSSLSSW